MSLGQRRGEMEWNEGGLTGRVHLHRLARVPWRFPPGLPCPSVRALVLLSSRSWQFQTWKPNRFSGYWRGCGSYLLSLELLLQCGFTLVQSAESIDLLLILTADFILVAAT